MTSSAEIAGLTDLLTHLTWLRRIAKQLVHDEAEADDVVQDAWLTAIRRPPEPNVSPRPWLFKVAQNVARMRARHERRLDARGQKAAIENSAALLGADQLIERVELQRTIAELVLGLEEPYRSTLLLRYYEERTAADIARLQEIPAGTVRWRLAEAIRRLRARLDEAHQGDRRGWMRALLPMAGGSHRGALAKSALLMTTKSKVAAGVTIAAALLCGGLWWQTRNGSGAAGPSPGSPSPAVPFGQLGQSTPMGSGTIDGQVVGPDGAYVAEAWVTLLSAGEEGGSPLPGTLAATVSDAHGEFRFSEVPPGRYALTAASSRSGLVPAFEAGIQLAAEATRSLRLRLGGGGAIVRGRILDSGAGPVAGARISAVFAAAASRDARPAFKAVAVADDKGGYALTLVHGSYTLIAEADGYGPTFRALRLDKDTVIDLELDPASRLQGRVIERGTRRPVAGAEVRVLPVDRESYFGRPHLSDNEGIFRIADLTPGTWIVEARKGRLVGSTMPFRIVPAQETTDLVVDVRAGFAISGRVVLPGGTGIKGAVVQVANKLAAGSAQAIAEEGGRYAVEGLLPGRYVVRAEAPTGHVQSPLQISGHDVTDLNLTLAPFAEVNGRVVRRGAQPAGDVRVTVTSRLSGDPGASDGSTRVVTTDAEGRFRAEGLKAGLLSVRAEASDAVATWGPEAVEAGAIKSMTLELAGAASLGGHVRLPNGAPAPGLSVSILSPDRPGGSLSQTTTQEDGGYHLTGLFPGRARVEAHHGSEPQFGLNTVLTELPEAAEKQLDLKVANSETIRGKVVLPDGSPAVGALVSQNTWPSRPPAGLATMRATCDGDGAFTLTDLDEGKTYFLWAELGGYAGAQTMGVSAGRSDVIIKLERPASIAGQVVGPQGAPISLFEIQAVPEEIARSPTGYAPTLEEMRAMKYEPSGHFELGGLRAGNYEVRASTDTGAAGRLMVILGAGEQKTDVRVVVEQGLSISGKVVDNDSGRPLPGIGVATEMRSTGNVNAETDANGDFVLTSVPVAQDVVPVVFQNADSSYVPEREMVMIPRGSTTTGGPAKTIDLGTLHFLHGNIYTKLAGGPPGKTGIDLARSDGQVVLVAVRPNTPAAGAGISVGDQLISIDGQLAAEYGFGGRSYLVQGKPGTQVTLVVDSKKAGRRSVTLVRAP